LSSPLHKTKGIVLRTVKYGETSLILSAYTELFGLQSYLVQGVRTASKKGAGKANYFQPGSILDLIVYHNELKHLNRIKEFKWHFLYEHIFSDVIKNSVLLFMVELLQKSIKQPEANPDLYDFIEESFLQLDKAAETVTANFPLFFAIHLTTFFGFQLTLDHEAENTIVDLQEGNFTDTYPQHAYYTDGALAEALQELMKVMQPEELIEISLHQAKRRQLLEVLETFYALHIPEFGKLKTLPVLQAVLD
jgi:DNA repair protein RecO (recombination protein O)